MENMKKFTKVTAGVLSFALALGAVSGIPQKGIYPTFSASAEDENRPDPLEGMDKYEYELKDVYIYNVEYDEPASFKVVLKTDGYYSTWSYSNVLEFGIDPVFGELSDSNRAMLDKLAPGTIATIKFTSSEDYPALRLTDEEPNERDDRSRYWVNDITQVKAPGINYYGDINDDGVIDSFDLIGYRKYISDPEKNPLSKELFLNADIDQNDVVDEADLQLVSDYILGKIDKFYGATMIGSVRLTDQVDIKASEGKVTDETFAKAEMKFGIDLLKKAFDPTKEGEENLLISPLSISSALAMTANGADKKTLEQMEAVLGNGMTLDELNEYMAYYVANLPDEQKQKLLVANSIWFRDDPTFKVLDEFLEKNKKYYNSEVYKSKFDDSTVNDVNSWVSENTKGMIPTLLKKGDLDPTDKETAMMMLINTLYFEAEWQSPYDSSYDGKFTDLNGVEHDIMKMSSEESEYFDLGDADAFKKPYMGGEYSFVGILPREKNIVDYVNDLDAEKLMEDLKECEDPSKIELHVTMPKFKYNYSQKLKDILIDIGMGEAFDDKLADFSKINDLTVEGAAPLYIGDVLHKTKIEVTEKGTKAAAVTAVLMMKATAFEPKRIIHIDLNRPFVYMIVDKNNVPVFIGAATQLEEA
ncbi:Serine protease inhibitor [Ruminococcus flavefaciens]|uniref:Serine protease inhibitor n=1 Tax=Ruminococcus flavefaciens TaxID=1265 RepID=A0A1H6KT18_RUMFL|nr:serpin family protein [Ruminococcus flavefaciens]SEH78989.1 Serine protease inhibitor [Ruminococcus flavefaciens]